MVKPKITTEDIIPKSEEVKQTSKLEGQNDVKWIFGPRVQNKEVNPLSVKVKEEQQDGGVGEPTIRKPSREQPSKRKRAG